MPEEPDLRARSSVRDSGLRRLRTVTGLLVAAMAALAGIFTGIAAGTTPGRRLIRVQPRTVAVKAKPDASRSQAAPAPPPPPALPPIGSQAAPTPAPAAPAQPPAATPAPPVVVSGGS